MLIGIDASKAAIEKRTGVENFVFNLILNLQKIDKKNTYLLFTNKKLPKNLLSSKNFTEIYIPFPKFWNKLRLPLALLKYKPERYIQPAYMIPAFAPHKTLAVFHDLAWIKFPEAYTKKDISLNRKTIKNYLKKAAKTICVSYSTEKDLTQIEPLLRGKTGVIHLAGDKIKSSVSDNDPLKIHAKYFISTSRLEDRKNTANIVRSFYKAKENGLQHKLVLVGKPGFGYEKVLESIDENKTYAKDIVMPGYVSDEILNGLLQNAEAFVYPSFYEGFGIPPLEAMNLGIPVITSNTSSLPEVVEDAAILVDPNNTNEISDAMTQIANDQSFRQALIEKGFKQAAKFSWEKTAKSFLNELEKL